MPRTYTPRKLKPISCEACGASVMSGAHNRRYCDGCGDRREALRRKEWWATNPAYTRQRYSKTREKQLAYMKAKYAAEPERYKRYSRAWYQANSERARARAREYRKLQRERIAAYQREWFARHPEADKTYKNRRRARIAEVGGSFTEDEFRALCERFDSRCAYCGERDEHLTADHIVPLSGGGANGIENIAPACKSCNCRKGIKTVDEFLGSVA